jgi:ABC-type Mn2+/Zn2+ transport system ATPase subunit
MLDAHPSRGNAGACLERSRHCALAIERLTCRHSGIPVVQDVDLMLRPGERAAVIGSNGAGKSTVLRAILGLHAATEGRIAIDGTEARSTTEWLVRRRRVAWMPQRQATGRFPLLVRELLDSSGSLRAASDAAARLDIPHLLERPLHTLSGGQLQRAFLARAVGSLAAGAGMLLADEPTSALDFDGKAVVSDVLTGLDATLLVVTHDRALADRCDRVFEMAGGRLREAGR